MKRKKDQMDIQDVEVTRNALTRGRTRKAGCIEDAGEGREGGGREEEVEGRARLCLPQDSNDKIIP